MGLGRQEMPQNALWHDYNAAELGYDERVRKRTGDYSMAQTCSF